MSATPSISKVPVSLTHRLDVAWSPSDFVTLSTPSETRVCPVKVFAPDSVSKPPPNLTRPEPCPPSTPESSEAPVLLIISVPPLVSMPAWMLMMFAVRVRAPPSVEMELAAAPVIAPPAWTDTNFAASPPFVPKATGPLKITLSRAVRTYFVSLVRLVAGT